VSSQRESGNANKTYPIVVAAAVSARSLEEAEAAVCAWAEAVSRPDPQRGMAAVNISLPADAWPGTSKRGRFTFPLAGQITVAGGVIRPGQKEVWDARATRHAANCGITVVLWWADSQGGESESVDLVGQAGRQPGMGWSLLAWLAVFGFRRSARRKSAR